MAAALSKRSQSSERHTCILPRDDVTRTMAETQTRSLGRRAFRKSPWRGSEVREGMGSDRQVEGGTLERTGGWTWACQGMESASGWEPG